MGLRTTNISEAFAQFGEYPSFLSANDLDLLQAKMTPSPGCTVEDIVEYHLRRELEYDPLFQGGAREDGPSVIASSEVISAGEALTVITPTGSWLRINLRAETS